MESVFSKLNAINVNGHTEQKNGLTYLSWAWAWAEVKKIYPDATYEIMLFDGLPYVYDPNTGYMVYTTVTIEGLTHMMWLPVMDSANKAMKAEPYEYTTGYGQYKKEKVCEAATMFDVNKTIMRCLVKNLAMFGAGLYIYAGEDLPEEEAPKPKAKSWRESLPLQEGEKLVMALIRMTNEEQHKALEEKYGAFAKWDDALAEKVIRQVQAREAKNNA